MERVIYETNLFVSNPTALSSATIIDGVVYNEDMEIIHSRPTYDFKGVNVTMLSDGRMRLSFLQPHPDVKSDEDPKMYATDSVLLTPEQWAVLKVEVDKQLANLQK